VARAEISVPQLAPGSLEATVEGPGSERPQAWLRLTLDAPSPSSRTKQMFAIVQGRASHHVLMPGRYKAELVVGHGDAVPIARAREQIVIEPATVWRGTLTLEAPNK
jgi:hypothetical protein